MTIRTVAGAGLAVALLVGGCQARRSAWNQTLAATDCHAANVIIKKGDPGQLKVMACGELRVYDCPEGGECTLVTEALPDAADPTAPVVEESAVAPSTEQAVEPESTDDVGEASDEPGDAATEQVDEPAADEASDEP